MRADLPEVPKLPPPLGREAAPRLGQLLREASAASSGPPEEALCWPSPEGVGGRDVGAGPARIRRNEDRDRAYGFEFYVLE